MEYSSEIQGHLGLVTVTALAKVLIDKKVLTPGELIFEMHGLAFLMDLSNRPNGAAALRDLAETLGQLVEGQSEQEN
ncbi:MAG: hypothetical protein HYX63_13420 [Gammaproteobacteria bacterium]|nr:hypothetical protein [Gammaproteobacteria bacterium]